MATGASSPDAGVVFSGVGTTGEVVGAAGRGDDVVGATVGVGVAVTGASGFGGVRVGAAAAGASDFGGIKTGAVGVAVTGAWVFGGVKTGAVVEEDGFAEFAGGGKG
mgnify:CR=1 FL=1